MVRSIRDEEGAVGANRSDRCAENDVITQKMVAFGVVRKDEGVGRGEIRSSRRVSEVVLKRMGGVHEVVESGGVGKGGIRANVESSTGNIGKAVGWLWCLKMVEIRGVWEGGDRCRSGKRKSVCARGKWIRDVGKKEKRGEGERKIIVVQWVGIQEVSGRVGSSAGHEIVLEGGDQVQGQSQTAGRSWSGSVVPKVDPKEWCREGGSEIRSLRNLVDGTARKRSVRAQSGEEGAILKGWDQVVVERRCAVQENGIIVSGHEDGRSG
ncbi:hypothetical protein AAG906_020332 [Vitis piasezkii]